MNIKKITILFVFMIFLTEITAQIPPQTVVFKVRKKNIIILQQDELVAIETKEEGVWFVEENATFRGGDLNTFSTWIAENIQYPAEASEAEITGKVIVQFSIGRNGYVVDVKIVRSIHPSLDKEAVRVISNSPKWQPAKQSGNLVKQNYVVPIVFSIQ